MRTNFRHNLLTCLALLALAVFPATAKAGLDLTAIGTYETGVFDGGASEIVAFDPETKRLFVINATDAVVDVLDVSDPSSPVKIFTIDVTHDIGPSSGVNSVDVKNGLVAVAAENADRTLPGYVVFYNTSGEYITHVGVGVLPDSVRFSPDGLTLVTADEGEPVEDDEGNLAANPPGSISVINISNGVQSAVVTTLGFEAFDGREAEFTNKGLRLEPAVPMSLELEPEYPAISPDGALAYVTIQEANAFAVVDLVNPAIIDLLPLGFKDHSTGAPSLQMFPFKKFPKLGKDANGVKIKLGGFSGLWYEGPVKNKGRMRFLTVGDRGPNGSDVVDGSRTFNLPDYQARIVTFEVNPEKKKQAEIMKGKTIYLTREDGETPITGLPNIPGHDEIPVDAAGSPVGYDALGADLEGIVRDPADSSFWMVDEYRPAIYHFSPEGRLIVRLVPENTHLLGDPALKEAELGPDANSLGFYGEETLPEVYSRRMSNRGFEGVALDPGKRLLYAFIQSPMENPDKSTRSSLLLRILAVDVNESSPTYLTPVAEYVYALERPVLTPSDVDKIGDAVFVGDDRFFVVERDSSFESDGNKYVFEIDLAGATDIRNLPIAGETVAGTLEQQTPDTLAELGIKPVFKRKVLNLPSIGYTPSDKAEGIAILPDGRIAVINDNDFGIEAAEGLEPVLGLISLGTDYGLDASDEDGGINILSRPVLGMFQPDTITPYEFEGKTYYVTANEGDTRDFDFFSEEERVEDLILDPFVFPDASDLLLEENLGRLKTTNIMGDIDGDGDNDRIFTFGARSFSIWDSYGNLVYDSGGDFERITAEFLPNDFNSDNAENDSFDSRSDDKGPEPEAMEIDRIGDRVFAFIGLERISGVMVYDVTDPFAPFFVSYVNNRDFSVDTTDPAAGDIGPECIKFVPAEESPNGAPILIVGNEISGTTTIYSIDEKD
ncbi:MAG TPA: choice-of-anchor I family protein [Thermodesulfobacteriota bacterium]|nr:choice-of-anchor I family protein [Thermodesulfobacteriota bacterium]